MVPDRLSRAYCLAQAIRLPGYSGLVTYLPQPSSFYKSRPGGRSARLATAGLVTAVAVVATGCSASSSSGGAGQDGSSARQAVADAARETLRLSAATYTISEHGAAKSVTGTVTEQLKPSLLMSLQIHIGIASGASESIDGVFNTKAMYLHNAASTQRVGKPWLEIPLSILRGFSSRLAQLFKSLPEINPVQQTAMLTVARNVRKAGTAVIDGVSTTHYTGLISPSSSLSALAPALRKVVASQLKLLRGSVRFGVWVDAQNHVRKMTETGTVAGQTITTTVTFSAINQPVHIKLPPPSQVEVIPASALSGASA